MIDAAAGPGGDHVVPVRVYWEDTDASGIVYHASYLRFAERARTEMLRKLGFSQSALFDVAGVAFAVRRCIIDYRAPARLDDALDVISRVVALGGARLDLAQRIERDGTLLASLDVKLACIDRQGRAARLPAAIREAFARQGEIAGA